MQQEPRPIPLRTKLVVALLTVALVPLMILTLLNKKSTETVLINNANQGLFALASQTATSIDVFRETNLDAVRVEAAIPGLVKYLSSKLDDQNSKRGSEDEAAAVTTLNALSLKDTVNIISYALLDRNGRNVLDTHSSNIGRDESDSDYFVQAVRKDAVPYASYPILSEGVPRITFSCPVRDAKFETIGILRVTYNLSVIQQFIIGQNGLAGEGSFALLLDEHHIRLADGAMPQSAFTSLVPLDPALITQLTAERRIPQKPVAELSSNLHELHKSLLSATTPHLLAPMDEKAKELNAVAVARLRTAPWTVAFRQPQEAILAPIEAQTTQTAFVLALLIAGVVTAAAIAMAQLLTRPIIRLTDAAAQLASGKLTTTVDVRSRDEMGVLAQSFNQMALQLRESFAGLEKANEELERRVEQRTAELKDAKVAADAANKAKSDFLASMSHELRTPLNGILGYTQILRRSRRIGDDELRGVDVIAECGSHLLMLINDVLDLAKIESQMMDLHVNDFDFMSFLRSTAEICRVRAEQKGIAFVHNIVPPLPASVRADQRRLRQVLINLLGNAIKFTEKGSVTFTVTPVQNVDSEARGGAPGAGRERGSKGKVRAIRFEIEDTGSGISGDHLSQIFLPFKQVGDSERHTEGTGLGLAISQRIVNLMGGSIEVKSELGRGSLFWMDLTLAESEILTEAADLATRGMIVGYAGRRRRVMVVDDDRNNRDVLVEMLQSVGFEMMEAANGQEGLEKAEQAELDLIITDLTMPVLDGWEMMQRLRKKPEFAGVTIIASSASAFIADQHKSLDAGANDFLAKPVQMDALFEMLKRHLKLEWSYEREDAARTAEEPESGPAEPSTSRHAEVVPPPAEALRDLLDLTRKGLINDIEEYADKLDEADPKLSTFTRQLRRLSLDFRLDEIEILIKKHMDHGAHEAAGAVAAGVNEA
jgi:signal transduction histidine kinase/CheY-like chemotaxis protein